jgi:hypothetical protein
MKAPGTHVREGWGCDDAMSSFERMLGMSTASVRIGDSPSIQPDHQEEA